MAALNLLVATAAEGCDERERKDGGRDARRETPLLGGGGGGGGGGSGSGGGGAASMLLGPTIATAHQVMVGRHGDAPRGLPGVGRAPTTAAMQWYRAKGTGGRTGRRAEWRIRTRRVVPVRLAAARHSVAWPVEHTTRSWVVGLSRGGGTGSRRGGAGCRSQSVFVYVFLSVRRAAAANLRPPHHTTPHHTANAHTHARAHLSPPLSPLSLS